MGWTNVPICDDHWVEEEGNRQALRIVDSLRAPDERCYRCGRRTDGIYVRRNIPAPDGTITTACARCGKEVSTEDATLAACVILGMTYDDVAVGIMFHKSCYDEVEKVYIPPRKADGMSVLDALDLGLLEGSNVIEMERDRREDVIEADERERIEDV